MFSTSINGNFYVDKILKLEIVNVSYFYIEFNINGRKDF